jgi:alpha-tubulin suppressor-like RCC1 family protein
MVFRTKCGESLTDTFLTEEDLVNSVTVGCLVATGTADESPRIIPTCPVESLAKGTTGYHTAFIQCAISGSSKYRLGTIGINTNGELGDFTRVTNTCPGVFPIDCADYSDAATGSSHTLAVKVNGSLWAWGRNNCNQIGDTNTISRSSPIQVSASGWKKVAAGEFNSFAISSNNQLYAWGNACHGQSGIPSVSNTTLSIPLLVGNDYKCVSAGQNFALALKTDNTIWSWGYNDDGRLGLNDTISRSSPVQICAGSNIRWKKISAGLISAAAIDLDGNIYVWGCNCTCSNLGLGTTVAQSISCPVQLSSSLKWRDVSVGSRAGAAISTEGNLYVWGSNHNCMLGVNCTLTTYVACTPTNIDFSYRLAPTTAYPFGIARFNSSEVESVNVTTERIYFVTRDTDQYKY